MTNNINKNEAAMTRLIAMFLILAFLIGSVLISNQIAMANRNLAKIQEDLKDAKEDQSQLREDVKVLQENQSQLQQIAQENEHKEQLRSRSISNMVSRGGFNRYTDIAMDKDITIDDMNKIIKFWNGYVKGGTRFEGHGAAFIEASKESGINPIIILAHAASESKWGNSEIAINKNNFFGINCIDDNPTAGSVMGDTIDSGIINGAIWIKKNFYNNGYTSLQDMVNGHYASDSNWGSNILSIANVSVRILQE